MHFLPTLWQFIAGTILASSTTTTPLTPQDLVQRFINEESHISSSGNLAVPINVAPVKRLYPPKGTSPPSGGSLPEATCFYCKKAGHKANECNKKKKDLENVKKGKEGQKCYHLLLKRPLYCSGVCTMLQVSLPYLVVA